MGEIILKQKLNNEFIEDAKNAELGKWIREYLLFFECNIEPDNIPDEYEITIQVRKK